MRLFTKTRTNVVSKDTRERKLKVLETEKYAHHEKQSFRLPSPSKLSFAFAFTAFLGGSAYAYKYSARKRVQEKFNSTFSYPRDHSARFRTGAIDRTEEKEKLKNLLKEAPDGTFTVLSGTDYSGKTILIHSAITELAKENVPGIVCVSCCGDDLPSNLAGALDLNNKAFLDHKYLSLQEPAKVPNYGPLSSNRLVALKQILHVLPDFAQRFAVKGQSRSRVTTIVIDDAHYLVNNSSRYRGVGTQMLLLLEEKAKEFADKYNIRLIFVDSSGVVLKVLNQSSAKTKMKVVFFEDVAKDKAITYLKENLKNTNVPAEKAFAELTGGRISLLKNLIKMANEECNGLSYEEIRSKFIGRERYRTEGNPHYISAWFPPSPYDTPKTKFQQEVIRSLYRNKYRVELYDIPCSLPFREMEEAIDEMVEKRLIRFVGKGTIAPLNQATETAITELDWVKRS